ncbi:MAG TPA: tetratricopeptide repeat protein [Thermodesulfovibrionales bacterium]|nr:tetratricopeptide repeat protein [Thermodesulfovibrionales bacterium]
MRRIGFIIILLPFMVFASCQQKESPKSQEQAPAGAMHSGEEIRLLQDAVKKDPGNGDAWIRLGNILMDSSRFDDAIEAYEKALAIDPKNVDVRVDLGSCYRKAGKPDRAVEEYRKALTLDPNHLNGHKNLAIVLAYDLHDRAQAVREFEKALALAPNASDAGRIKQIIEELKAAK